MGQRCGRWRGGFSGLDTGLWRESRWPERFLLGRRLVATQTQVFGLDGVAGAERHGAVQDVFKLAHISREGVALQGLLCRGHELRDLCQVGLAGDAAQHLFADQGQVVQALTQGGQCNLDHIEAVKQILPKAAGRHLGAQVLVAGADDAHVHGQLGNGADRAHGTLLNGTQQLGLHAQGQVADFIEEQGAASGGLEEAFAVVLRTGEGAFAITKELGLQQLLGDGAAVDGNEGLVLAHAHIVDGARDQLLAGARFAPEQHGGHAARDLFNEAADLADGARFANQARQRRLAGHDGRRWLCQSRDVGRCGSARGLQAWRLWQA